jgi:hypothetical protein
MKINIYNHNSCNILQKICADEIFKSYKNVGCSLNDVFLVNNIGDTYHVLVKSKGSNKSVAGNEYLLLTMTKDGILTSFKEISREKLKKISIVD